MPCKTTVLYCTALLVCLGAVLAYEELEFGMPPAEYDTMEEDKRAGHYSAACRRCMHRPSDWGSCNYCYGGVGGMVPYFGFAKRASDPTNLNDRTWLERAYNPEDMEEHQWEKRAYNPSDFEREWNKRAFNPAELEDREWEKRAYNPSDWEEQESVDVDKRATNFLACKCCNALRDAYCCQKCNYVPYYGRGKRSYETSFTDMGENGACRWCSSASFDFFRCMVCTKRKRK